MMPVPHCVERRCMHFEGVRQDDGKEENEVPVCPAYPKGIPSRIAFGMDLHESVSEDQVGTTVYEEDPDIDYRIPVE